MYPNSVLHADLNGARGCVTDGILDKVNKSDDLDPRMKQASHHYIKGAR